MRNQRATRDDLPRRSPAAIVIRPVEFQIKVPSTVGPDQAIQLNWVYRLPFGTGRRFGGGASASARHW